MHSLLLTESLVMYISVVHRGERICAYQMLLGVTVVSLSFYLVIYQTVRGRFPGIIYTHHTIDDPDKLASFVFDGNDKSHNSREAPRGVLSGRNIIKREVARASDEPCTFALFRRYYETYHYFPGSGLWNMDTKVKHFQPDFCKFRHPRMKSAAVAQCLMDSKVQSIMTMGDSNAHRYFNAVKRSIASVDNCHEVRIESVEDGGFLPDKTFYQLTNKTGNSSDWENFIEVDYRYCRGCRGEQQSCSVSSDPVKNISLEHLSMDMLLDGSVQIRVLSKTQMSKLREHWSPTAQETLFKHFLKGRYPDILLMFLPFNHAKYIPGARFRLDLQYFLGLVRYYLPKDTRVIFMPTFSEFELRRKVKVWVNATFENMLATDKIDHLNHMLFDMAREEFLDPYSRKYGFLDLVNVSKPLVSWSFDGVHMEPLWYDIVMSMLWETYCNSLRLDAF